MLIQKLLCCCVRVLGNIEGQLQGGHTFTHVNVKDMVILDAAVKLFPVLTYSIDDFSDL